MNLRIKTLLMISLILISSLLSGCSLLRGIIPSLPNKEASPVHNLSKDTIYVPDDYSTIQAAVDAASPGDTIIVRDGTYTENVNVNKDHLTIKSENGAEKTIVQATNPDDHVFEVTADYVNIRGFTIVKEVEGYYKAGIYLKGSSNCNITNNICKNNAYQQGIYLYSSSSNTIMDNICSNNGEGIRLSCSGSNTITNNTCSENDHSGIVLTLYSNNNTIADNSCLNNLEGIGLWHSSNNIVKENTFEGCGIEIHGDAVDHFATHVIENNAVNGKPIYYYKNSDSITVPQDAGQVIIANCSDITLRNINASSTSYGIELAYASNSVIENNIANSNNIGIFLTYSSNNIIRNNICSNNHGGGIYLCYSNNNNTVMNNNCTGNTYGMTLSSSSSNRIINNDFDSCGQGGIGLVDSSNNNIIMNNSFSNIWFRGIWLTSSNNNKIYLNNFMATLDNVDSQDSTNTWNSPEEKTYTYNDDTYINYLGNYWSDYTASDADRDGIGDTPYAIDGDSDNYPLMVPFENYEIGPISTPSPPSNLKATAISFSQITLSWTDNSTNEKGFKVERKIGAGSYAEIATVAANVINYTDSGLAANTTYTYRVKAYNDVGNSAYSNETSAFTTEESREMKIARLITQEAIGGVPVTVEGQFYIILTLKSYIDPITLEVMPNVITKVYVEGAENYPVSNPEIARKIGIIDYVSQLQKDELHEKLDSLDKKLLVLGTLPLAEWPIEALEKILGVVKMSAETLIQTLIKLTGPEIVKRLLNSKEEIRIQIEENYRNAWDAYFQSWNTLSTKDITDYAVANTVLEKYLWGNFYEEMGRFLGTEIFPGEAWEWVVRELAKVLTWGVSEEYLARIISIDYDIKYWNEEDRTRCELSKKPYEAVCYTLKLAGVSCELTVEFNKCISKIEEETARIREDIADYLERFGDAPFTHYLNAIFKSPGELRVYDSQGRVTGLVNGEVKEEIPNSYYYNHTVAIFYPSDSYRYEVVGTDEGTYGLEVNFVENGETIIFSATDIPVTTGAVHQYTIDWDVLSQGGEEGVTVQIDFDGDGTSELTITTGSTFIFIPVPATIDINPDTLNLNSKIKWVTAYIELPEDYDVTNIDVSTVNLWYEGNNVPAEWGDIQDGTLMVKFNGKAVQDLFTGPVDAATIAVTGVVQDGTPFGGNDTIKVLKKP